ncbi:protein Bouncer-like [Chiloscyllium plagiosum]|uniref:protein Bouncer-like n=1 Tax=Chiloscyllium plagiosum TaxID=36176 RepID=UPI001CB837B8|nr:protein Bouncer-like [Chiloscyllium plagiosum]
MKHLLLFASLGSYFVIASALMCYKKYLRSTVDPLESIKCNETEQCYKQVGSFPKYTFYIKGCIASSLCGQVFTKMINGNSVTFRTICCATDLCNGSLQMGPSLVTGFMLMFGWCLLHV